jgi:putative solute:sodium symporter small subunit
MNPDQNSYHFSFFKPSTDSARRNRNMVLQLVFIWAVAIFGFQFLLKMLETPTAEPVYALYEESWPAIEAGDPAAEDMQKSVHAALSVLGKVAIQAEHRQALDNGISWMAMELSDSIQLSTLLADLAHFEHLAASTSDITDASYVEAKEVLIPQLATLFQLDAHDVRAKIAPLEVRSELMKDFGDENRQLFCEAMDLYLVHNQSVLTDMKFLGFPFHYFYTAVFLLILFVGLCWLYCVRTDGFNKKYGIEE